MFRSGYSTCRPSVGPSTGHVIRLTVPAKTATLSPLHSACALRACLLFHFSFLFVSFLFLSFRPFLVSLIFRVYLNAMGTECSWCYFVASDTGWSTTARWYRSLAYWYCSGRALVQYVLPVLLEWLRGLTGCQYFMTIYLRPTITPHKTAETHKISWRKREGTQNN